MIQEVPWELARNYIKSTDVVGMRDIARIANLSYWYVRALACDAERSRPPFPKPYTKRGNRNFWLRADVQNWVVEREQLRLKRHEKRMQKAMSDDTGNINA